MRQGENEEGVVVLGRPATMLDLSLVSEDLCPLCLGELDTGWECDDCTFDAYELACVIHGLEP